jgi:hypothetical protein
MRASPHVRLYLYSIGSQKHSGTRDSVPRQRPLQEFLAYVAHHLPDVPGPRAAGYTDTLLQLSGASWTLRGAVFPDPPKGHGP